MRILRRGVLALAAAITISLLTSTVERAGPEVAPYGNMCGPRTSDPCYEPQLKGGYPIAYLFDAPGVSVEHRLSFGEDRLDALALAEDAAIWFVVALSAMLIVARHKRKVG